MRRATLFLAIAFLAWSSPAWAQTPMRDRIRTSALEMNTALHSAQYGKLVDLMYPTVVQMGGGRDQVIAFLKAGVDDMAKQGYKFGSVQMGLACEPVAAGNKMFSVVPQTLRMTGPKVELEQSSYVLAISADQGKTWTFIDGAGLKPETVRQIFPDFPASLDLPEPQPPKSTPTS